jgi:hypothetical protein
MSMDIYDYMDELDEDDTDNEEMKNAMKKIHQDYYDFNK